jgi:hypothetical protein
MRVGSITTDIVSDGLVLNMDAANRASYIPDNLSTINTRDTSFSGSLNGGVTLIEPPISSSCWALDGVDDYIFNKGIPAFNVSAGGSNKATVDIWMKRDYSHVSGNSKMVCAWRYYAIYNDNGRMGFNTGNGDVYGLSKEEVTALNINNIWTNWTFFWNLDVSYTNNKIYVNGELQSISQVASSEAGGNRSFNDGNFSLGCWNAAYTPGIFATMEVQSIRMYNRELSAAEVLQNYNALKGRFGL